MNKNIFKGLFAALLCMATVFSYAQTNQRYYWVGQGGNGNWGNLDNWAFESGGSIHPGIVPGNGNTVVFDANSGLTPTNKTINIVGNALCDSLIIEASVAEPPIFEFANLATNRILISGSFLNYGGAKTPTFTLSNSAYVYFLSSRQNESIFWNDFYGIPAVGSYYLLLQNHDVNFTGSGKWTLLDDMYAGKFNIINGTVNFNSHNFRGSNINVEVAGKIVFPNSILDCAYNFKNLNTDTDAMPAEATAGSLIKTFYGHVDTRINQVYNNVELGVTNGGDGHEMYAGTFHKITVLGGYYNGMAGNSYTVTVDSLIIYSTQTSQFGRTVIKKLFRAKPLASTCGGQIQLCGKDPIHNDIYYISLETGAKVDVQNAIIYNLWINGGTATASNSYDFDGNDGWSFTDPEDGRDMYWIHGTDNGGRNWQDPARWSLSSGGPSANCVPTLADNVIFNTASNITGFIGMSNTSQGMAYCNDITYSGVAEARQFTQYITIGGSLNTQSNVTFRELHFISDRPDEIINSNNCSFATYVYFRSAHGTGGWKFTSGATFISNIYFERGHLDFNEQTITCAGFFGRANTNTLLGFNALLSSRTLNMAHSTVYTCSWEYDGGEPLIKANTANSLITNEGYNGSQNNLLYVFGKTGDIYNNVKFAKVEGRIGGYYAQPGSGKIYFNKVTVESSGTCDFNQYQGSQIQIEPDSLLFTGGGTYTIYSGFTVNKYLGTPDDCSSQQTIYANSTPVTITMGTELSKAERVKIYNTTINNVSITTTTPDGDYTIANSTLQGTSNGWITAEPAPKTYYWVGGAGVWTDSKHWSLSSGLNGGYYDDGTGCTPTYKDDVIFDDGSSIGEGDVTITGVSANCNNMSWQQTENCGFNSLISITPLYIYGSLILQKNMDFCRNNTIYFMSTRQNETLQMNGYARTDQNGDWRFNGGGSWKLLDSLNLTGSQYFINKGHVDFSGQYIHGWQINVNASNNPDRSLDIRNATLNLQNNYLFAGVGIQAENSTIYFGGSFTVPDTAAYHNIIATGDAAHAITAMLTDKIQINGGSTVTFNHGFITDTLILANNIGNTYIFESGKTFMVNKTYYGSGTPCNPIYLRSSAETSRAIFDFKRPTANYDNVFVTDWADTLLIDYAYIHGIEAITNGGNNVRLIKGIHAPDQNRSGGDVSAWGYGDGTDNYNLGWAAAQPFANTATPFPALLDLPCTAWGSKFSCKTYFLPNYASTFKWRKGTKNDPVVSEEIYVILDTEAQYICTVDYGNGCTYTDSVNIIMTPADTLVWVGANRDYYNLANWTIRNNGLPAIKLPDGCTDVYIPAGLTNYPDLSPGITNYNIPFHEIAAAKNIWFEHGGDTQAGGELVRPDSLHYVKAFANIRVKPLRWYNLTAPFRDMYSGDFAFDRINPLVEMRLFKTESPQNGEMAVADWTTPFSTDTVRLNTADGFSVRVGSVYYPEDQFWTDKDWGLMEGATSITLTDTVWQFPKENTHWDFYHERTKEKVGQTQELPGGEEGGGRNYAGKFTFESDLGPDLVTKTIPGGYASREVIIGNPFMSHFDFTEFYRQNSFYILPEFYLLGTDASYRVFSATDADNDGYFDVSPAPAGNPIIAPMQSIIVALRDFNVPWPQYITFTNIMSISNTTSDGFLRKPTLTENRLASISASRGLYSSEAFVQTSQEAHNSFAEGEDALLLKSEGLSNLAIDVFTVASGKYLSVNRINEEFDTIHIGLMTKSNKGLTTLTLKDIPTLSEDEQYFFEDKALAITLPITDNEFSYQFDNQVGNVLGRFAIYKTPAIINGVQDPKVTDNGAQAFIYGDMLNVVSKDGSAIQAIMIYDTKGVLIYENQNVNSTSWQMPAAKVGSQVLIVKVVTTNGAYAIKVTGNK